MRIRVAAALLSVAALFAGEQKVIPVWPGPAPGSEHASWPETEAIGPNDTWRRVSNVTHPTLTIFLPERAAATGTGIVVCPGGGFTHLAIDHEGTLVARWLNSIGVAAFVLKYRVARTGDPNEKAEAGARRREAMAFGVADTAQAMRVVREHAAEFGVTPDHLGLLGFSAGGYTTAFVALHHDAASRPAFAAPIYPAAPDDLSVPADAPPLFLLQANNDRLVPNAIRLYNAWTAAHATVEMHVYATGGHGFGMKKQGLPTDRWYDRFSDWLAALGVLHR